MVANSCKIISWMVCFLGVEVAPTSTGSFRTHVLNGSQSQFSASQIHPACHQDETSSMSSRSTSQPWWLFHKGYQYWIIYIVISNYTAALDAASISIAHNTAVDTANQGTFARTGALRYFLIPSKQNIRTLVQPLAIPRECVAVCAYQGI